MTRFKLLTREEFKAATLARCGGKCCVPDCVRPAVDAHHIIERRLWEDGGYYAVNGAPLCSEHHFQAETTEISVENLRSWCGIKDVLLPPQFVQDDRIDKWGNYVLPNGSRFRGEIFDEEAVQKALALGGFLGVFLDSTKHPRTPHLPWSPGATSDDRILTNVDQFVGKEIIVSQKYDGESSTLTRSTSHARSLDSAHHPSRDWLKSRWSVWRHDIPERWRVVGEGLYAKHSIGYSDLPSFFLGFNIWDDKNFCLSWDDTLEWFALIGAAADMPIQPVSVLYRGIFDEKAISAAWEGLLERDRRTAEETGQPLQEREGYVVRNAGPFAYRDFGKNVAKYVRPHHVTTSSHWMSEAVVPNRLAAFNNGSKT